MSLKQRLTLGILSAFSARGAAVGVWFAATAIVAALGLECLFGTGLRSPVSTGFASTFAGGLWMSVMVPFYFGAFFAGAANFSRFGEDASFGEAIRASIRITLLATLFGLVLIFLFLFCLNVLEAIHHGRFSGIFSSFLSVPILFFLAGVFCSLWTVPVGCISGALLFAVTRTGRAVSIVIGGVAFLVMGFCLLFGVYQFSQRGVLPASTPKISTLRPPGTPCGPKDSASVKRADQHPLGPTGGWSAIFRFDDTRTRDFQNSAITFFDRAYTGYLRFPEKGTLKIRAYDDIYGSVYCGWSDKTIPLVPSNHANFFQLGPCTVGDGGVSTVHEICWFPEGQSEGRVILSSAHGNTVGEKLDPADLFDESMLSPERHAFHETGLLRSIALSFAKRGDFSRAREIITKGIDRFNAQPPAKEMPGGRSVSAQELDADEWVLTLSMELGLDFALNDFEAALPHFERLEKFVSKPPKFCSNCEYTRTMLPLYRWLFDFERAAASGGALPELPAVEGKNVWGHNPVEVVKLLKQPASSPASKSDHAQYEFWIAVRCLMNGDSRGAVASFRNFLGSDRASYSPFEGIVAAKHSRG